MRRPKAPHPQYPPQVGAGSPGQVDRQSKSSDPESAPLPKKNRDSETRWTPAGPIEIPPGTETQPLDLEPHRQPKTDFSSSEPGPIDSEKGEDSGPYEFEPRVGSGPYDSETRIGWSNPTDPSHPAQKHLATESWLEELLLPPRRSNQHIELPTFVPGEILAGRYKIVRLIARGGMGEVYEAEDMELLERIALKTIRPAIAGRKRTRERLKREIHLARRVIHPNVCRILEFSHHRLPPIGGNKEGQDFLFLTMELLEGETLWRWLKRTGRLSLPEALPLIEQIARGLEAAHEVGVVHCDLKSENILLINSGNVPAPQDEEQPQALSADSAMLRAVIMDFGVAQTSANDDSFADLLGSSDVMGTPPSMAPEQMEGEPITAAVDIYALGIVMFEMATGRHPFAKHSSNLRELRKQKDSPPSAQEIVPDLALLWDSVIQRCLAPNPLHRYSTVQEVLETLKATRTPDRDQKNEKPGRRHVTPWSATAALFLLLTTSLFWGWFQNRGTERESVTLVARSANGRQAAAILGFRDLSGHSDNAWLSTALSEMLGTELGVGNTLRIISGEQVAQVKRQLGLAKAEDFSRESLDRLHRNLGAEWLVLGSYLVLDSSLTGGGKENAKLRFDLRVQEMPENETVVRLANSGSVADLLGLIENVGSELRHELGVKEPPREDRETVRALQPRKPEARRLYAEGLSSLRSLDALGARRLLEKVVKIDPGFPLAHSALAEAWSFLGYDKKAVNAARRAFELSDGLARKEKLFVEGRYHEMARNWDAATKSYGMLFDFFPDEIDYGLHLAAAQTAAGQGAEALETIAALRRSQAGTADDLRFDFAEAEAASALSDFKRQLEAIDKATRRARESGAEIAVARAKLLEYWARRNLGQLDEAKEAAAEARRSFEKVGDRGGLARALNALATLLSDSGRLDQAKETEQRALRIFRELGDQRRITWSLNNLANALRIQGSLSKAEELYEETLRICREIGDRTGEGRALKNLGIVYRMQGKMAQAMETTKLSENTRRAVGDGRGIAQARMNLAVILSEQGELDGAEALFTESLELAQRISYQYTVADSLFGLAHIAMVRGRLPQARKMHQQVLDLRSRLGDRWNTARSQISLAVLALAEDRPEVAGFLAGAASEALAPVGAALRMEALRTLCLSLLNRGRLEEARAALGQASALLTSTEQKNFRWGFALTKATLQAASEGATGRHQAIRDLEKLLGSWPEKTYYGLRLEARLELARLKLTVETEGARHEIEMVAVEAGEKGFSLLAKRAGKLSAP